MSGKVPNSREDWLIRAVKILAKEVFGKAGHEVPDVKVSVGWPMGGRRATTLGECWATTTAADGINQIFVTPKVDDPVQTLNTLAHEIAHAVAGTSAGHRAPFKRVCDSVGLTEGKPTAAQAGPELLTQLAAIAVRLGEFPHSRLTLDGRKKQSTRLLKIQCPDCGCVARMTAKWVEIGLPTCYCGGPFEAE